MTNKRRVPYVLFLTVFAISFVIGMPFMIRAVVVPDQDLPVDEPSVVSDPVTTTVTTTTTTAATTTAATTEPSATEPSAIPTEPTAPTEPPKRDFRQADMSYFDDALFIGDSRSVGLRHYGGLKHTDFFVNTGMSVYNVEKTAVSLHGKEDAVTLHPLLNSRQYGKIYVMLGINELGYNFNKTVARYETLLNTIRAEQPDATLFVCANLHVAAARSDRDKTINNKNINRFNKAISAFADQRTVFYIDVNELFDDGKGNLRKDCTSDNTHVYARCYAEWVNWLCGKAV